MTDDEKEAAHDHQYKAFTPHFLYHRKRGLGSLKAAHARHAILDRPNVAPLINMYYNQLP
ncbi:hypothetical protein [uncultured Bilophila sp.]|uniref:hypothetical protein n=1 Tax=uncultured Bilophila sp. TaxID=529385 RepID=UPI00280BCEB5|nr:hypothetical protein [uncultured Bilophila sp.]